MTTTVSPPIESANIKFHDLFDLEEIQIVQDAFAMKGQIIEEPTYRKLEILVRQLLEKFKKGIKRTFFGKLELLSHPKSTEKQSPFNKMLI